MQIGGLLQMNNNFYNNRRIYQSIGAIGLDAIMIVLSYLFAVLMFHFIGIQLDVKVIGLTLPYIIALKLIVFYIAGVYKNASKSCWL